MDIGATVPHVFTRDELAAVHQDKNAKKLIVVDNKVYDITEFMFDHPGGPKVIATQVGRDATDVFHEMHPPSAYEHLASCYIGDCEPLDRKNENSAKFAQEIREYRDVIEKLGYFEASTCYYVYKVTSTLLICVIGLAALKVFGKASSFAVLVSAMIVGLFWQQCGWLAHDFAHYQVIKDPVMNDFFLVVFGNLVQGFSLSWWKNKHNTHHASTNVSGEDPDIDTAPFLLWDELAAANYYGSLKDNSSQFDKFIAEHILPYQTRYYFFLLAFARFSWAVQSLLYSFNNDTLSKSKALSWCERIFLVVHWVFFAACVIMWTHTWKEVALFFITSQITTGYLLAFVFAMNHNGMPVLTPEQADKMEFYEIQVITGRDITLSGLGDWIFGGLNYQIEHHVFPEMPRHKLSKVKPAIKQICKKYNIRYHDTTVIRGTIEVLQTLDFVQHFCRKFLKKVL